MPPHFSPDEVRRVRAHRLDTHAYVLVRSGNCFGLSPVLLQAVKVRRLVPVAPDGLARLRLPRSWILAVPLCPGETVAETARFAKSLPLGERHRIWFFETGPIDVYAAYAPWRDAGLGTPRRDPVRDLFELNRILANELNIRILLDHLPPAASSP